MTSTSFPTRGYMLKAGLEGGYADGSLVKFEFGSENYYSLPWGFVFASLFEVGAMPFDAEPYASALLYGLFFGAIVIPCNPGIIAAFFSKALATTTSDFLLNMLHFLLFGVGIGFPLLVIALVSGTVSQTIVRFLVRNKGVINRVAGVLRHDGAVDFRVDPPAQILEQVGREHSGQCFA